MRSAIKTYAGMIAFAILAVLVFGAIGVRIDRGQTPDAVDGIAATPAITGNAPEMLVDVQWLQQYGSQVDYIFDLGDRRQYDQGHIPGARHIWWQDAMRIHASNYSEPDNISRLPVEGDVFGYLNLHIPQNARVVLYDSNGSERATWLLWVMTLNGYTDVVVLDGGLAAWNGAGGELTTEFPPALPESVQATPTTVDAVFVKRDDLKTLVEASDATVVDTRSTQQMTDTVNGTIREGHIPGAVNIPTAEVMRPDGTFRSPEELQAIFASHGLTPDTPVVVYSLFAHQSGSVWLALHIAGFGDVRVYYSGYVEWGWDTGLPIETDPFAAPATPAPATPATPAATPHATPQATAVEGPTDLTGDENLSPATPESPGT